jgi:hypothetical protein
VVDRLCLPQVLRQVHHQNHGQPLLWVHHEGRHQVVHLVRHLVPPQARHWDYHHQVHRQLVFTVLHQDLLALPNQVRRQDPRQLVLTAFLLALLPVLPDLLPGLLLAHP